MEHLGEFNTRSTTNSQSVLMPNKKRVVKVPITVVTKEKLAVLKEFFIRRF